jgi:hypothetical protein
VENRCDSVVDPIGHGGPYERVSHLNEDLLKTVLAKLRRETSMCCVRKRRTCVRMFESGVESTLISVSC